MTLACATVTSMCALLLMMKTLPRHSLLSRWLKSCAQIICRMSRWVCLFWKGKVEERQYSMQVTEMFSALSCATGNVCVINLGFCIMRLGSITFPPQASHWLYGICCALCTGIDACSSANCEVYRSSNKNLMWHMCEQHACGCELKAAAWLLTSWPPPAPIGIPCEALGQVPPSQWNLPWHSFQLCVCFSTH